MLASRATADSSSFGDDLFLARALAGTFLSLASSSVNGSLRLVPSLNCCECWCRVLFAVLTSLCPEALFGEVCSVDPGTHVGVDRSVALSDPAAADSVSV